MIGWGDGYPGDETRFVGLCKAPPSKTQNGSGENPRSLQARRPRIATAIGNNLAHIFFYHGATPSRPASLLASTDPQRHAEETLTPHRRHTHLSCRQSVAVRPRRLQTAAPRTILSPSATDPMPFRATRLCVHGANAVVSRTLAASFGAGTAVIAVCADTWRLARQCSAHPTS